MFVLLQKFIYCLEENLMSISINQTATTFQQSMINGNKVMAVLVKTRKQKQKYL